MENEEIKFLTFHKTQKEMAHLDEGNFQRFLKSELRFLNIDFTIPKYHITCVGGKYETSGALRVFVEHEGTDYNYCIENFVSLCKKYKKQN